MNIFVTMIISFLFLVVLWTFVCLIMSESSTNKPRGYEVRFEPRNNKYYIVCLVSSIKEERITGRFGLFTIYYDNQIDADLVVQRLKGVSNVPNGGSTELK